MMNARQLALTRGKTGNNQRFSTSRPVDQTKNLLLQSALVETMNNERRSQILNDPMNTYQFACRWDDNVGFLTRPTLVPGEGGNVVVCGSFTDTIGQVFPVSLPLEEFRGYFTTLVPRGVANRFNLSIHPQEPSTVAGPPPPVELGRGARLNQPAPVEASLERLDFPMPEDQGPDDLPVVVALPMVLPIGPGQTFPHVTALEGGEDFAETFPLFDAWKKGMQYCITANEGRSVTTGGPLFHLPGLAVGDGDPVPFGGYSIRNHLLTRPQMLAPGSERFGVVADAIQAWSDTIWIEIGAHVEVPEPPVAPPGGFGATEGQLRALMEPIVNRDKGYRLAARTAARYRLLLAGRPPVGAPNPDVAVLPPLRDEFVAYLGMGQSAAASEDLREMVRQKVVVANAARVAQDKDATFEADNVTLAFSDRVRAFRWVVEQLRIISHTSAKDNLGMLQFLSPDRATLACVAEGDSDVKTLVMANASSNSAQLDASKASKMYSGGRLTTFRHSYEAFCNLRLLFSVMVDDTSQPMVLQKLHEYTSLLVDSDGRKFFEVSQHQPYLAIHPWQDLQHILSAFLKVATNAETYNLAQAGNDVLLANYDTAIAVADGALAELRAIIFGNGLGKFGGQPCCYSWFSTKQGPEGGTGGGARDNPKRQRITSAESERHKKLGVLNYDPEASGTTRLPNIPVYAKKRGSKKLERLCMSFLTRGYSCDSPTCRFPHVSNINTLGEDERKKFIDFVKNQPGLTWVDGKAPSGTN